MNKLKTILLITVIFSNALFLPSFSASSDGVGEVYIRASDKLGVGIKTPTVKLTINGNLLIKDGTQSSSRVLKTDENGLASWQDVNNNSNGEWTDTGTLLHSNGNSGAEDMAIGGTTIANADILFQANATTVINEQAAADNTRVEGDTNQNLLTTNGDGVSIGLLNAIEKLNINGALALDVLSNSPSATSGYGKVYVNGSILNYKTSAGIEYDLALGAKEGAEGSTTQVQYNMNGSFKATEDFVWQDTNTRMGLKSIDPDTVSDSNGAFTYRNNDLSGTTEIITYVNGTTTTFNGSTTTANSPSIIKQGDLLIAIIYSSAHNGITFTTPAGWTKITDYNKGNPDWMDPYDVVSGTSFYKIAGLSDNGVAFDFTASFATTTMGALLIYDNADTLNPLETYAVSNGDFTSGLQAPSITTTINNSMVIRAGMVSSSNTHCRTNGFSGHTLRIPIGAACDTDISDKIYTTAGSTGTASSDHTAAVTLSYIGLSIAINPQASNGTELGSNTPDDKSSILWLKSNGDTMVKTDNGSELKEFTLINFQGNGDEITKNGLTLTGLDPNKLVRSDVDKKLTTVDEITLNGSGLIGIGAPSPSALLDIGAGTITYIDGTDDMLVKDDLEVDGDIFGVNFTTPGNINGTNIIANAFNGASFIGGTFNGEFYGNGAALINLNPAAGSNGYIHFNSEGKMGSNGKLYFDETNTRIGLDSNLNPDTVLDVNGEFTYRGQRWLGPIFRSFSNGAITEATSLNVDKPTGVEGDDILIAIATNSYTGNDILTPAGWTKILDEKYVSGGVYQASFYKVAGGSEPTSYTFDHTGSTNAYFAVSILAYRNGNTVDPIDNSTSINGEGLNINVDVATPGLTTNNANCLILRSTSYSYETLFPDYTSTSNGYIFRGTSSVFTAGLDQTPVVEKRVVSTSVPSEVMQYASQPAIYTFEYTALTIALSPYYTDIEPETVNPKRSILWNAGKTDNWGDTIVKTNNGSETKAFTLINFNGDPLEKGLNGLTLTSLDPNKLVRTDSNKKLTSVDEITLNGSGLIGINNSTPAALLDLNGSITYIDGTDDMLVKDDLEVDGDTYGISLETGSINGNNIVANTLNATNFIGGTFNGEFYGNGAALINLNLASGSNGYIQYNIDDQMTSDSKLYFDEDNIRVGLDSNLNPDTVLDENGAFTYRTQCGAYNFRSSNDDDNDDGMGGYETSLVINKPTNSTNGDVFIAAVAAEDSGISITPPVGWTEINSASYSTNLHSKLFYKEVGGSEPASFTFTISSGTKAALGEIYTYNGQDFTSPMTPVFTSSINSGTYSNGAETHTYPGLDLGAGERSLRIITTSGQGVDWLTPMGPIAGYTQRAEVISFPVSQFIKLQDRSSTSYANESASNYSYSCSGSPDVCVADTVSYIAYTVSLGAECPDPESPDNKTSVLWLKRNGDTMVKTNNGSELKEFTLVDFQAGPDAFADKEFNGMTLTSLDPNKLIKSDSNKELISVNAITINGSNLVGVGITNPNERLTVNGSLSLKETSAPSNTTGFGKLYTKSSNSKLYFKDSSNTEFSLATEVAAGSDTEIQFNNSNNMGADSNLSWDSSSLTVSNFITDKGNLTSPGISFSSDTDTGIYSTEANFINFINGAITIDNNGNIGIGKTPSTIELEINGSLALTGSSTTNITNGTGLTVTNSFMKIQGNGATVNITANPQIVDGTSDGQIVTILGLSNSNTVVFEEGNGLSLTDGIYAELGLNDTLVLIYDASDDIWIELSRSL